MLSNPKIKPYTNLVAPEIVIVDEASQIEVGDYLPLLHLFRTSLKKLVFIGDDKQRERPFLYLGIKQNDNLSCLHAQSRRTASPMYQVSRVCLKCHIFARQHISWTLNVSVYTEHSMLLYQPMA